MENNGYFSSYGTICSTRCDDDSIRLNGVFRAMVEIIARLSGNGLKDKFMRMMEKNE